MQSENEELRSLISEKAEEIQNMEIKVREISNQFPKEKESETVYLL